jgi:hypothetical protein
MAAASINTRTGRANAEIPIRYSAGATPDAVPNPIVRDAPSPPAPRAGHTMRPAMIGRARVNSARVASAAAAIPMTMSQITALPRLRQRDIHDRAL